VKTFNYLLGAESNEHAQNNDSDLAQELSPAVQGLG
jgi:hypothetical protein